MKKLLWIGLAFLVVLVGCDLATREFYLGEGDFPEDGKGMLVLILDGSAIPTKSTVVPPSFSMDIFSYDITGKIGTETQFIDRDVLEGSLSPSGFWPRNGLTPAKNWTIEVIAKNTLAPIGQGTSAPFEVKKNEMANVTVIIQPITGDGTLTLVLSWPKVFADTPKIEAWLTPAGGTESDVTSDFDVNPVPDPCTATYSTPAALPVPNSLPTGYYKLQLYLQGIDPADPPTYKTLWGDAVAIRIIDGQESVGSLQTSSGGANVTISPDLKKPIDITITEDTITPTSITAIASFSEPVAPDPVPDAYDYDWYIDGTLITSVHVDTGTLNSNTQTITVASGSHNLSVLVTAWVGSELDSISSATYEFTTPLP